jgi:hypothetical protein
MAGYGRQIVSTASLALIFAIGIGVGVYLIQPQLGTGTSSISSRGSLASSSATGSESLANTTKSTTTNLGSCSTPYQGQGNFSVNEGSNLDLCVKFYYYSSSSPINVMPTDQVSIQAYDANTGISNAMSNFTVIASPSNFSIGGSTDENEGIGVEYQIHANSMSHGTYILNLGWLLPQQEECTFEFSLVVGNGIPDYTTNFIGHCVTQSGSSNYPYPPNTLYAEIIGYSG